MLNEQQYDYNVDIDNLTHLDSVNFLTTAKEMY